MDSINLVNSSINVKRNQSDFYPTPDNVTDTLLRFLNLSEDLIVWEPACGEGHMANVLKRRFKTVICSDLHETGYGEPNIDFLKQNYKVDFIITNPPFCLAEDFIKSALRQADIVAMLLKTQYWHSKKRTKLFNENPPKYVLPLNWRPDFRFNERADGEKANPLMDVMWNVWFPNTDQTIYKILEK